MSNENKFPLKKILGHECWLKSWLLGCVPRARASLERPDVLRFKRGGMAGVWAPALARQVGWGRSGQGVRVVG
eukprot:scaffold73338_cov60-Phaeocystis_antarctica.AAC.8